MNRIAFEIGNIPVTKYGLTLGFAVMTGIFLLNFFAKKISPKITSDDVCDFAFWLTVGGIVGARLWYVVLSADFYLTYPYEILAVQHGGLSIQGALAGGALAAFLFSRKKNLPFLALTDLCSLVLPICQAIGRLGNYFNGEAFGLPCNLPWKIYIPFENRPLRYLGYDYFHPTFLYEMIANIFIFFALLYCFNASKPLNKGFLTFLYLILYSTVRIFIEFIRVDSVLNIFGIPVAVWVSVAFVFIGLGGLFFVNREKS